MEQTNSLRLVFAGTPVFAAEHLRALLQSRHEILAVYTQPDRPAGRGKTLTPGPVKQLAIEHNLPVYQPVSLKPLDEAEKLRALDADALIVVAYGLLLPLHILNAPKHGCLNVHGSILPRWRGAAPIQRAIEAGDKQTGITIMQMDEGLDTGDMLLKTTCDIHDDDTAGSLLDRLAELGPPALLTVLDQICKNTVQREKQDDALSTYAKKITKQEAAINWEQDAETICLRIRAFNPTPVCSAQFKDMQVRIFSVTASAVNNANYTPGEVIQLTPEGLLVACGKGAINVSALQLPGKKLMSIKEFCNGYSNLIQTGMRFS